MIELADSAVEQSLDLASRIGHRLSVDADDSLESVRERFEQHAYEYMAVLEGQALIGLCSRSRLGMVLGSRYGHAVFARRPIKKSKALFPASRVTVDMPIDSVLQTAFTRSESEVFDDVALLDSHGGFLGLIFAHTLVRIQTQRLLRKVQLMQENLHMARDVQQALLPRDFPQLADRSENLRFAHRYLPADIVSGDFFHTWQIDESSVGVFICDVMGHGVQSAFATALLRALVEQSHRHAKSPGLLLEQVNRELTAILPTETILLFATALYLTIDIATNSLVFANAGHPAPIRYQPRRRLAELLQIPDASIGSALGLLPNSKYPESRFSFPLGAMLVLYTDGIYEVTNAAGLELNKESLAQALTEAQPSTADRALSTLLDQTLSYATAPLQDDVCLVAIHRSQ
ncbi:SpoIIE family protein phosphatase [Pelagicoccus sp. SDUM812003]|uniref:PP2C family protein-serine/threonine phosphatase n=1 Tax=Pelagicoccus sp. SDUM812003 TaxID=3041267 RepID=UPI00280EC813|nr:SpoIIE family protein phosphatase [Pelagicoccus sp. SDUM812003]MDQ8203947.1 SpoIIE family protein phosphatase [Pelagicoccus sp. SDUM812003]